MPNFAFVIPLYNHHQKIFELVQILWQYKRAIIIVDDGSSKLSKDTLKDLSTQFGGRFVDDLEQSLADFKSDIPNLFILTHSHNQGKGASVKTAAKFAFQCGFSHIFQLDADMQHDLGQIPSMIKLSKENPKALICGYGIYGKDAPKARLWGRKITNFWLWVNSLGGSFRDAMTGFRIYPLDLDLFVASKSNRMEFDIEILLLFYRARIAILWYGVGVKYGTPSNFKGFRDNILISKMHARAFCQLPFEIIKKIKAQKMTTNSQNLWHKRKEKGSIFWIKLSFLLVRFCPRFILKIIAFVVSLVFWSICSDERKNINRFYANLKNKFGIDKCYKKVLPYSFWNFYEFALSVVDKIGVYLGKIGLKDLHIRDRKMIENLFFSSKGRVILMSHFGNIEIAKALSKMYEFKIIILVYQKNSANFNALLKAIGSDKIKAFSVDDLGVEQMLEISHFVKDGGHLCVMGDRVPLDGRRTIEVDFLGQSAIFPQGGALMASILDCELWSFWCVRNNDNYEIWADLIDSSPNRAKVTQDTQKYISLLEANVAQYPQMWFNFFDIWAKG